MKNELRLPSHDRTVTFREVTVQDALDLAGFHTNFEEKAANWWLTTLQDGEVLPAEEWSQEDRIVGLIYLFFLTQDNVERQVSYNCKHCGNEHQFIADYGVLAKQELKTFDEWPTAKLKTSNYKMQPLTGAHLAEIEILRMQDPKPTEDQIRLQVIARRLRIDAEELTKLPLKKYAAVLREAEEKLEDLRHGIDLGTTHVCPEEGLESQIALPFRTVDFLPRI